MDAHTKSALHWGAELVDYVCPYCKKSPVMDTMYARFWIRCNNYNCPVKPGTKHYEDKDDALFYWLQPYLKEEVMPEEVKVDAEKLLIAYLKCKESLGVITKAHEAKVRKHKAALDMFSTELNKIMLAQGLDSIKKKGIGTAFLKKTTGVAVEDWNKTLDWIKETGNFQMLNKSVGKAAVVEYKEAHEGVLPPGLKWFQKREVSVRKA